MAKKAKPSPNEDCPVDSASRLHIWQIQAVRDLLFVAAVIAVFWAGYALRAVTVPLLVALLLAYLFEPLIQRLCRHPKVTRVRAVTGLLVTIGVVMLVLLAITVPVGVRQAESLIEDIRSGRMQERIVKIDTEVRSKLTSIVGALPIIGDAEADGDAAMAPDDPDAVARTEAPTSTDDDDPRLAGLRAELDERDRTIDDLRATIAAQQHELARPLDAKDESWIAKLDKGRVAKGSLDAITGVIGAIVQAGLLAFLIPFYFFFFSVWYPDVAEFARGLVPERNRGRIVELLGKMDAVVAGFVRGRIVISLIMGALLAIGWMICGVPFALLLGLVVGIFCAVPYLGVIGIPLAVIALVFQQLDLDAAERMSWFSMILWPTVVFAIVQLIEGYVLTPAIAGKATNLDPVTILVVVLAGGSVLGVYGMLLAIPVAACGKILATEVLLPQIRKWGRGEVADPLPINRD